VSFVFFVVQTRKGVIIEINLTGGQGRMAKSEKHQDTLCVQAKKVIAGNDPVAMPIYQTSTFRFESVETLEGYLEGDQTQYLYTRYENPTLRALQEKLAEIEKGEHSYVFASGMAAITTSLLAVLKSGDELLAADSLYGRTQLFIENWLPKFGIKTRLIPVAEFPNIDRYFTPQTRIVYIESPTNPTLQIIDIRATTEAAHSHDALLYIDNTFATPINQNPIDLGADVVLHSATKYLAGHSDLIGGVSVFPATLATAMKEAIRTFGGTMDPFAAFLLERGLKTLPVRVRHQSQSAMYLATRCSEHPKVKRVNYPGLKSHPGHEAAQKQMRGFGAMFSFDLESYEAAKKFVNSLHLIHHAASLGGVETLVSLPVLTSHYAQPEKNLHAAGISRGTVRVSVGLEAAEDLWRDMERALA
jgi:methionine-gamma-lyase